MSEDTPVPEPPPGPAVAPAPDLAPVTDAAPAPDADTLPDAGAEPPPPPSFAPRRRGRTTVLIAAAAVLGVLAGAGLGYRVQDQRKPTPLPPLTGSALAQPRGAGAAPAALPAAQDRDAVYEGDLLKLLVPTPKGAKQHDRRWITLADYAEEFERPQYAFTELTQNDFRRAAGVEWQQGAHTRVGVTLLQFRDEAAPYTPEELSDQQDYADDNDEQGESVEIPGTMDGKVWPSAKPYREPGYEPDYSSLGLARVGDIFVEVAVDSTTPLRSSVVMAVITKQLERL